MGTGLELRTRALLALVAVVSLAPRPAAAEVFYSDDSIEISGSGSRSSRSCVVSFKPALTSNADAPRLTLETKDQARLAPSVEKSRAFSGLEIVQNNVRRPLLMPDSVSNDQFKTFDLAKALQSGRPFFVTGQMTGGRYVSSRYEAIKFDLILSRIEANCPFDAESLMADLSARQRAESALFMPASRLKAIRWALNKIVGGFSGEPDYAATLTPVERNYLKKYAAMRGLPISQYLTQESAQRLATEGEEIVRQANIPPPAPPAPPPERWNAVAAGISKIRGGIAHVAIGYSGVRSSPEEAKRSAQNACSEMGSNCKPSNAWNSGCVYITTGVKGSTVKWASGDTVDAAVSRCRQSGYSCKAPIGGCVD